MNRREWLEARQNTVGSSDAANLIGIGFRDALAVYHSKTDPVDDSLPADGYLRRGIELEPLVVARYEEVMQARLTPGQDNVLVHHPDRPWQSATPDRRRQDDGRPVEAKTVAGWGEEWGESGTDEVPPKYRVQAIHQLGVTGDSMLDLIALNVIDWSVRVYRIDFDPALFEWLTDIEKRFYEEYVVPRVAPPPKWEEQWRPQAPQPVVARGTRVDLGADLAAALDKRKTLLAVRDEADAAARRITEQVEAAMGGAEAAVAGFWKVRRSFVKGGHVEYDRKDGWRTTITGG